MSNVTKVSDLSKPLDLGASFEQLKTQWKRPKSEPNMYNDCIELIKVLTSSGEPIKFEQPVVIRFSPHAYPVNVYRVRLSPVNMIWVQDEFEEWYDLNQAHAADMRVLQSVFQRLQIMVREKEDAV